MTAPALDTTGMADARAIYREARRLYAPRQRKAVVPWAESERILSVEGSAEAGRYSLDRTPWWREVLERFADETTEEIVVAKSSQVGYTELLNTFIGWCMAEDPSSLLMIQPTVEMAEAWSKERLAPMLRDTPALKGILRAETRGMARSSWPAAARSPTGTGRSWKAEPRPTRGALRRGASGSCRTNGGGTSPVPTAASSSRSAGGTTPAPITSSATATPKGD
jgi:hypothetical protein